MINYERALNFDLQIIEEFCRVKRTTHPTVATLVYLFGQMPIEGVDFVLVQLFLPADQELSIVNNSTTITPVHWTRSRGYVTGVFRISKKAIKDFPTEYITRINGVTCFELLKCM